MKEEIIAILNGLRPEFDFSEPVDFIEEGMLDSFDVVNLVDSIETKFSVIVDGLDIIPENFSNIDSIVDVINRSKRI